MQKTEHPRFQLSSLIRGKKAIITALLSAVLLWAVILLIARTAYILNPYANHSDAAFYFTIGRAILNGLTPYADIFDPKPPAIFLLSATSLAFLGNQMLGNVVSVAILFAFPILLSWLAARNAHAEQKLLLHVTGFLVGALMGLWSSVQAGVWQPETFGNFFVLLYIIAIVLWSEQMNVRRTLLMALLLLCAFGFKEPFLFATCSAALILSPNLRTFLRVFILPISIALLAGTISMFLLGWLEPYVQIYLPAMVGIRIQGYSPLWIRGLPFWELSIPLSYTSLALFPSLLLVAGWHLWDGWRSSASRFWTILSFIVAAYLSVTAVRLAGNYTTITYSAVLIPFALALVTRFLQRASGKNPFLLSSCVVCAFVLVTVPFSHVYSAVSEEQRAETQRVQEAALRVDALVAACNTKQYLYAVNPPHPFLPAYTQASPLNHFPYREIDNVQFSFPFARASLDRISASVVVLTNSEGFVPSTDFGGLLAEYFDQMFTTQPWPCAVPFLPIDRYGVLFRQYANPISVTETINAQGAPTLMFEF